MATAIVTGSNTGIGEITARELAREGLRVYLACRNVEKATAAMGRIRTDVPTADLKLLKLDLASLDSVRRAAGEFLDSDESLELLINNAGLAGPQGLTDDGFELTFGVNHLGHFLFTMLLMDRVIESAPARIINVASKAHYRADDIDWEALREPTRSTTGMHEYEISKLANVLFTCELDRRLEEHEVSTYSLHPGVVASDIWERRIPKPIAKFMGLFMISPEDGAKTTLHCALDDQAFEQTGLYWDEQKPKDPNPLVHDPELRTELWQRSLEWTEAPDWPR